MVAMPSLHRSLAAREPFICRSEFLPYEDIPHHAAARRVSRAAPREGLALCGGFSHELPPAMSEY